jgi:hypothetical protein
VTKDTDLRWRVDLSSSLSCSSTRPDAQLATQDLPFREIGASTTPGAVQRESVPIAVGSATGMRALLADRSLEYANVILKLLSKALPFTVPA